MKIRNYVFLIILLVVLFLPLISLATHGDRLVPCGPGVKDAAGNTINCQFCHLFVLFQNVINFLLIHIVPVVAVLMLVIGGFMYVFAYFEIIPKGGTGGPALLSRAKSLFTYAIVGLIIIYASWLIINLFFQVIGVADWTGLRQGWWRINCPASGSPTPTTTTPPPGTVSTSTASSAVPPPELASFTNDDIAEDLTIVIDPNATTGEIIIEDSAYDICDNQATQFLRQHYPNFWVVGGCINEIRANEIKAILDQAYSLLNFDFKEDGNALIVPDSISFNEMLNDAHEIPQAQRNPGLHYFVNAIVDRSGTMVLGPNAITPYVIIHEEGHQMAVSRFGSLSGNLQWINLHYRSYRLCRDTYGRDPGTLGNESLRKCGYASSYATATAGEDLAETLVSALLDSNPYPEATDEASREGQEILRLKFQFLKDNNFIREVPLVA